MQLTYIGPGSDARDKPFVAKQVRRRVRRRRRVDEISEEDTFYSDDVFEDDNQIRIVNSGRNNGRAGRRRTTRIIEEEDDGEELRRRRASYSEEHRRRRRRDEESSRRTPSASDSRDRRSRRKHSSSSSDEKDSKDKSSDKDSDSDDSDKKSKDDDDDNKIFTKKNVAKVIGTAAVGAGVKLIADKLLKNDSDDSKKSKDSDSKQGSDKKSGAGSDASDGGGAPTGLRGWLSLAAGRTFKPDSHMRLNPRAQRIAHDRLRAQGFGASGFMPGYGPGPGMPIPPVPGIPMDPDPEAAAMIEEERILNEAVSNARLGFYNVPEGYRFIVEKDGHFHKVLYPGSCWVAPGASIEYVHYMGVETLYMHPFHTYTREGTEVLITCRLLMKVDDPVAASYAVDRPRTALSAIAQTKVKEVMARIFLTEAMGDLELLNRTTTIAVNHAAAQWGYRCIRVLLDVDVPINVRQQLEEDANNARAGVIEYNKVLLESRVRGLERAARRRERWDQELDHDRVMIHRAAASGAADYAQHEQELRIIRDYQDLLQDPLGANALAVQLENRRLDALSGHARAMDEAVMHGGMPIPPQMGMPPGPIPEFFDGPEGPLPRDAPMMRPRRPGSPFHPPTPGVGPMGPYPDEIPPGPPLPPRPMGPPPDVMDRIPPGAGLHPGAIAALNEEGGPIRPGPASVHSISVAGPRPMPMRPPEGSIHDAIMREESMRSGISGRRPPGPPMPGAMFQRPPSVAGPMPDDLQPGDFVRRPPSVAGPMHDDLQPGDFVRRPAPGTGAEGPFEYHGGPPPRSIHRPPGSRSGRGPLSDAPMRPMPDMPMHPMSEGPMRPMSEGPMRPMSDAPMRPMPRMPPPDAFMGEGGPLGGREPSVHDDVMSVHSSRHPGSQIGAPY